jgi:membrane protein DedA with SNARE-associated domain
MNHTIALLLVYKYYLLLPLDIIEGPIISVVAAFLSTMGIFNIFAVYALEVAGDLIGDIALYSFGRWGKGLVERHGHHVGATKERLDYAKKYFEEHHHKAITASKLLHGVGITGLIAAGNLHVPFGRYLRTCISISLLQALFFASVGVLFGHAYDRIGKYLNYYAAAATIVVLAAVVFLLVKKFKNRPIK